MTTTKRRTARHRDVEEIEHAVLATLGGEVGVHTRKRIRRAAELQALSDRCRELALSGEEFDVDELNRLESVASEAMGALDLPKARHKITVAFVDQQPMDLSALTDEQLAQLEELLTLAGAKQVDVCDRPLAAANDSLRRELGRLQVENDRLSVELARLRELAATPAVAAAALAKPVRAVVPAPTTTAPAGSVSRSPGIPGSGLMPPDADVVQLDRNARLR